MARRARGLLYLVATLACGCSDGAATGDAGLGDGTAAGDGALSDGAARDAALPGDAAPPADAAAPADSAPPADGPRNDGAAPRDGGASAVTVEVLYPPAVGQMGFTSVQKNLLDKAAPAYPYVGGAVILIMWSDFDLGDAQQGTHTSYDFQIVDDAIQPWVAAGKPVNLVLQSTTYGGGAKCPATGTGSHGLSGTENCAMPQWMWTALGNGDATTCGTQMVPNYRSTTFQSNYQLAMAALINYAAKNPNVGYLRIGLGKGGEINLPSTWEDTTTTCGKAYTTGWGYTVGGTANFTWNAYLQSMLEAEGKLASPKQLMVSITPVSANNVSPDAVTDFLAPIAVANRIGFGNQGLSHNDLNNCAGAAGDWCNLFAKYTGQVPLQLQTLGASCPAGFQQCASLSGLTGPLPPLIQFALPNHVTILEIYSDDWLIAYDPANPDHAQYGAAYAQALADAATYQ